MSSQPEPIRIRYIDDDREFAAELAGSLEREDRRFDVETAATADEGLDRVADGDVDCVVSDYDLAEQDGVGLLDAVRERSSDLPFVLYTAHGSEDVASDAVEADVTHYLQKEPDDSQYRVLANHVGRAVETRRTRRELADRERRPSLSVEQSPLGVIEWDDSFDCVRANSSAERILGYTEAELSGRSWESIVPESDRGDVETVVSELLKNKGGYHSVNENVRRDGSRVVCEWHNRVVTDDEGAVVAIFSQFQDVTERERNRQDLERQNERLEEFASIVSHDLRNPLNVAGGRLELVRDECDSEHTDAIARAHDRMERLIDELLTLAREGETVTEPEWVGLSELAATAWRNVETSDATLTADVAATARADSGRVEQLLENLFRNAVEHGGGDVAITVGRHSEGFYIADDGPGIPVDARDRVFDSGYTTSDDGTGFGLAIVREIAEAHGWVVRATESRTGGARFEVTGVEFG